jgi:hypothetical protein
MIGCWNIFREGIAMRDIAYETGGTLNMIRKAKAAVDASL